MDNQIAHVLCIIQEAARFHDCFAVARRKGSGGNDHIGFLQAIHNLEGRQTIGPQTLGIHRDSDLATLTANDGKLRHVGVFLNLTAKLCRNPAQLIAGILRLFAPEGERQNGDIINGLGFHHGLGNARRDDVVIGHQFVVQLHQAVFHFFAHVETDDGHIGAGLDDGIDILNPFDLPEEFLHRDRYPFFDLFRGCSGIADKHIDHGNDNLRFLLPGRHNDGKDPEEKGGNDEERRQLRFDEGPGNFSGNPESCHFVLPPVNISPSVTRSMPDMMTRSLTVRPDRISVPPAEVFPVRIRR